MSRTGACRPSLACEFAGIRLRNPVLASSGTFGYGEEMHRWCRPDQFGGIIVKSLTREPRAGNPPPRVAETPGGMLNSIGLQNVGVDAFLQLHLPVLRRWRTPIVVNVAGSTVEEYVEVCRRVGRAKGIAGIELNVSCPNVKSGGIEFGKDPKLTELITKRARRVAHLPLIVKLPPNLTDIGEVAIAARNGGASAISLVNTYPGIAFDRTTLMPFLGGVFGGVSGPAIRPMALRCVWDVAGSVDLPILGGGGIVSGRDAAEFLAAGASAVAIGTAVLTDPSSPARIARELRGVMRALGISRVRDLSGLARKRFPRRMGRG